MNGAAALYYNSTATAAAATAAAAPAATGAPRAGWGGRCLLEHATRFWRIDKTSASNR